MTDARAEGGLQMENYWIAPPPPPYKITPPSARTPGIPSAGLEWELLTGPAAPADETPPPNQKEVKDDRS